MTLNKITLFFSFALIFFTGCSPASKLKFQESMKQAKSEFDTRLRAHSEIDPKASPQVEKSVRNVFNKFSKAVKSKNGASASKYISQDSIDYFSRLKSIALNGRARQVKNLSIVDKTVVLSLRHLISKGQLSSMSGKEVFQKALSSSWISPTKIKLGFISHINDEFNDSEAFGFTSPDGKKGKEKIKFVRQDTWKIDLVTWLEIDEIKAKKQLSHGSTTENDYVFSKIAHNTGRKVRSNIWLPELYR